MENSSLSSTNDPVDEKTLNSTNEVEEIDESFLCCVCLDLLYKPIVLACGHISCFWCVHMAMSSFRESHCPICRDEYNHFPSICEMLHFLLLKMYPLTYKRREKQLLEEEKRRGSFSPQFDDNSLRNNKELDLPCPSASSDTSVGNSEVNDLNVGACKLVSINDALCTACKELLFQPVVLNCGHAYCESCLAMSENETLRCQLCQSPHPKGFPKVCLELDHLMEAQFPKQYMLRKEAIQLKAVTHPQKGLPSSCNPEHSVKGVPSSSFLSQHYPAWLSGGGPSIHTGAGCDYCGMYPIIGERYQCKDCKEAIGFDLCGECYNTPSKRPGRFNQQHTLDHSFRSIHAVSISEIVIGLIPEHSEDESADLDFRDDNDPEDTEGTHSIT